MATRNALVPPHSVPKCATSVSVIGCIFVCANGIRMRFGLFSHSQIKCARVHIWEGQTTTESSPHEHRMASVAHGHYQLTGVYTPYRADAPSRSAFVAWTSLTPCVSSSIQVVAFQPSFSHARSIASRCRKLLRTNACALPNPNSPPILAKLDKVCSRCPPRDRDHRLASPLVSTCWSTYNWQSKSEPGGHVPVTAVSRKSALYFWQSAAGDGGDRVSDDPVTLSLPCLWLSEHQSSSRWLSIHKSEKGDGGDEVTGCCRHSLCVHVSHTMPMQIVFCAMGFLSCTLFLYLIF
jgi:hypothetical protein